MAEKILWKYYIIGDFYTYLKVFKSGQLTNTITVYLLLILKLKRVEKLIIKDITYHPFTIILGFI